MRCTVALGLREYVFVQRPLLGRRHLVVAGDWAHYPSPFSAPLLGFDQDAHIGAGWLERGNGPPRPVLSLQCMKSKRARKRGGVLVQDDQGLKHAFHLGVGERVTGLGSLLVQARPERVGLEDVREFLRVANSHTGNVAVCHFDTMAR